MITLRNVNKSYTAQTLFDDISLQINGGDKFALVGPNGSGKSTLFKMIMGLEEQDEGEISLRTGVTFGYLPQESISVNNHPLLQEVLEHNFEDNRREARAKKILMGLGFRISDFDRPLTEFSGGWRMRSVIAKLLLKEPDILMLDEPTNHLDLEALLWFQNHLRSYSGAIFLISHDREFINSIAHRIVEIRDTQVHIYTGTFEDYLEQKKQEEEKLLSAYKRQQKEIQELETYINRFRAKASVAASVQSKIKYIDKMKKIVLPKKQKTVGFSFPQPERSGQNVLILKDIKQSYDGKSYVYDGLDLILERGQIIALVGPNGAGKSTLLKLLAGILPFQSGERKVGFNVEVGYFSQNRLDMFQLDRTVFEEAKDTQRAHSETGIRTLLGSFLFTGDFVHKKVRVLSGGEKSRLGLARILLDPPNLLLMDEPTTHLDMSSVEVLIQALKGFQGTFCFISHDIYFIRQLATQIIHINQGKITWYPGDYDYFLHKKTLEEGEEVELFRSEERIEAETHKKPMKKDLQTKKIPPSGRIRKTKEQKRREAEERNARSRLAKEQKAQGEKIRQKQEEEEKILNELADPNTHQYPKRVVALSRRLGELKKKKE